MKIDGSRIRDIIKEEIRLILLMPEPEEYELHPSDVTPLEDAWAGGDNIEDPLDHARFETGESNSGPHQKIQERIMKITRRQLRQIIKEETTSLVNESPPGVCFSRVELMMNPEEFAGMEPPKGDPCYDEWEQNYTDMGGIVDDESGVQLARPDDRKPKKESLNYESSRLAKIISEEIEKELKKKKVKKK